MKRFGRPRKQFEIDEAGQDSFLDTIANFVGVLIILVVVVGAHSRNVAAKSESRELEQRRIERLTAEVDQQQALENSIRTDNRELEFRIRREERLLHMREAERAQILLAVAEMEQSLQQQKSKLAERDRQALAIADQLQRSYRELRDLEQEISAVRSATEQSETIEHHPTPIAKTVFRDEVHFRLSQGKISHVPLNELIELMRNEWRLKAEKLNSTSQITETVGPIGDFRLQYELSRRSVAQPTPAGPVTTDVVQFERFTILPIASNLGEQAEQAMQPTSEFYGRIERLKPDRHTISIWVYPDSYEEYNQLKNWLYQRGFQTATWPLSTDSLISGGPNGYRTTAQ